MRRNFLFAGLVGMMLSGAGGALANDRVVFSSIPSPQPANVASEGPEAYAYREIGDGITFPAGTGGTLTEVTVMMSSWACTQGNWFTAGTCLTRPRGATFNQPITMNIYALDDSNPAQPKAGALLATVTQTFDIPYRPSSDTAHCPSGQQWYNPRDGQCYHGLATPITFDFGSKHLALPSQIVVGVSFNTSDAGPHPLGALPCRSKSQGCPYDSLNVSTDGLVFFPTGAASSVIDPNGIFFNYISTANACNPSGVTPGALVDDTVPNNGEPATELCFTGYHPELEIRAKCGDDHGTVCSRVVGGNQEHPDR